MKMREIICGVFAVALAVVCHAQKADRIEALLDQFCDDPEAFYSRENQEDLKIVTDSFSEERFAKLGIPDEALSWMPPSGPCGGPGSPLLIAFLASVTRDEASGRSDQIIYRGWKIVLSHYLYFRTSDPDDFPAIPALEEMAKKERAGVLVKEAAELEAKKKGDPVGTDNERAAPARV
jgi:hypothetical protein